MRVFMTNPPPINIGAPVRPRAVPVHAAGHRHRRALSLGADPRREDEGASGTAGRQQRPAGQQPADLDRPEPRPDFRARPHGQPGPDGDVQCLRHAADLADLRARTTSIRSFWASLRNSSAIRRRCRSSSSARRAAVSSRSTRSRPRPRRRARSPISHTGQIPSVTISFNLKPGVALGDAVASIQAARRQHAAVGDFDELSGHRAGVPGFAAGTGSDSGDGDRRHLPRARASCMRASPIR